MTQKSNYMICPACGGELDFLALCDSCEWEDLEENEKHQKLLNEIRPYAGDSAYLGHGCMVCPDCEESFHWKSKYCPVQFIYSYGINRLLFLQPIVEGPENPVQKLIDYWTAHSKSQYVLGYRAEIFKRGVKKYRKFLGASS